MVLPLTDSPGAPGQGALAIECRSRRLLPRAHCSLRWKIRQTRAAIVLERQLLAQHGGGCHQRFGATLQWLPGLGGLLQIAGRSSAGADIAERRWLPDATLPEHVGRSARLGWQHGADARQSRR